MDDRRPVNEVIKGILKERLEEIESLLNSDVLTFYGPIYEGTEKMLLKIIEDLVDNNEKRDKLTILLTTTGGSAIAVERYVNIIRHHYKEVDFVVPDYAYSAGTLFCMSGDSIHMNYYSVLGPVDPQIQNKEGVLVPALGYLDKVKELVEKSRCGDLTDAEFIILKDLDLAELRSYEQAKELTIDLLKKWLVKYKFKNWETHKSNPQLKGKEVTLEEKQARAEEIADMLSDNNKWKSHGRPINIESLEKDLRLKIDDYSRNAKKKKLITSYHAVLDDYIFKNRTSLFLQTKSYLQEV